MKIGLGWSAKEYWTEDCPPPPPTPVDGKGQEETLDQLFPQDHKVLGLRLSQYPRMLFQNKLSRGRAANVALRCPYFISFLADDQLKLSGISGS